MTDGSGTSFLFLKNSLDRIIVVSVFYDCVEHRGI